MPVDRHARRTLHPDGPEPGRPQHGTALPGPRRVEVNPKNELRSRKPRPVVPYASIHDLQASRVACAVTSWSRKHIYTKGGRTKLYTWGFVLGR
uniref:WD_REPEATS_REGION domain-containing protein n=1 Tax=Angiostrongylus cantonensis TaxID=6313 RepID=A0A0K0DFZ3_ANGCA